METKRELNDILINDDDLQKQNRTKKLMMMIGMAIVFLCILIAVIFVITRDEEDLGEQAIANNNGLTPIISDPIQEPQKSEFENVPLDKNAGNDDRFQQILDDIRSRDPKNPATQSTSTQTPNTPPLATPATQDPKPAQKPTQQQPSTKTTQTTQNQPVLPTNPATPKKQEPVKVAQTASTTAPANTNATKKPEAAKPTPTPTQAPKPEPSKPAQATGSVANAFEGVATPRMDTSKNGQVAEKGFYVQVGSFANKPSEEFLKKISNYSYRVYAGTSSNGQSTTKYLIGPYNSRTEAGRDLPNFKSLVADPVHFEVK